MYFLARRAVRGDFPVIFHTRLTVSSACIASIIRVPYIAGISLIDPSWSDVYGAIWSIVELTMGTICACLPTLHPIYVYVFRGPATGASGSRSSDKTAGAQDDSFKLHYPQMADNGDKDSWKLTETSSQECGQYSKPLSDEKADMV